MAKSKKDTSHCIIRNGSLFCMNCGDEKIIKFPIDVGEYCIIADNFTKLHADCKPTKNIKK